MIRWWEWLRAPEVPRWQEGHRVGWDETDGRNGGAERTAWETFLEMDIFEDRSGEKEKGVITPVLDLPTAFERVSLPVVWAWATHFDFPRKILRMLCGFVDHQRRVQFEGCVAEPLQTITAIFLGRSGVACSFALCCKTP